MGETTPKLTNVCGLSQWDFPRYCHIIRIYYASFLYSDRANMMTTMSELTCHSCWVPRCCRQCHASVDVISCRCGCLLFCWMNRHTGQTTASDPVACFLLKHVPRRHAYSEISSLSQIAIFSRQTYTQSVVLVVITWHFVCCWHWHKQLQTYLFSSY